MYIKNYLHTTRFVHQGTIPGGTGGNQHWSDQHLPPRGHQPRTSTLAPWHTNQVAVGANQATRGPVGHWGYLVSPYLACGGHTQASCSGRKPWVVLIC